MDRAGLIEAPIVDEENEILVDRWRVRLFDHQDAMEPAGYLLPRPIVRVIPERTGIGHAERVVELLARRHGILCQAGNTVHRVGDPHAVPVNAGRLRKAIDQPEPQIIALPRPQHRARRLAVKSQIAVPGPSLSYSGAVPSRAVNSRMSRPAATAPRAQPGVRVAVAARSPRPMN